MHRFLLEIPLWGEHVLRIPSYGVMLAIGALVGIYLAGRRAAGVGFRREKAVDMGVLIVLWGVVGARLLYVVENAEQYFGGGFWSSVGRILAIWKGGLVFYGGFIAAVLYVVFHFTLGAGKEERGKLGAMWDLASPSVMIALGFTRVGCFLNGCCYGRPTDSLVGVTFPWGSFFHQEVRAPGTYVYEHFHDLAVQGGMLEQGARSIPVQPVQLYAAVFGWAFGALLYWYWPRRKGNGEVGALLVLGYSVFRFLVEFLRINPRVFSWAPFSISQWIGIPAFLFAVWLLLVARGVLRSPASWLGPIEPGEAAPEGHA